MKFTFEQSVKVLEEMLANDVKSIFPKLSPVQFHSINTVLLESEQLKKQVEAEKPLDLSNVSKDWVIARLEDAEKYKQAIEFAVNYLEHREDPTVREVARRLKNVL